MSDIKVQYKEKTYTCDSNRTLLFTMNEQGAMIPHSCQQGLCQSCLTQVVKGKVSETSQVGLSDKQKEQGYFLPCVCKPQEDLILEPARKLSPT
ncbi:MAG TPA: 2Fe-2S iron-sulfur cluster binding domain-containing protein [Mariprofundaceae bacterium]|nr:2Fe-2S iron-sulfur cluster binding domain-containing protein [Mariprofundaceae bacterium]